MASSGIKQNFSIIILLAVLFGACSEKEELPEDILSKEKMTHMMIQIHLIEAKVGRLRLPRDSQQVVYRHFEKELLKEMGIDSATYFTSFGYYSLHPALFTIVYEAVGDSLMEIESKEKLKEEAEKEAIRKSDSIQTLSDSLRLEQDSLFIDSVFLKKPKPLRKSKSGLRPLPPRIDSLRRDKKFTFDAKQPD